MIDNLELVPELVHLLDPRTPTRPASSRREGVPAAWTRLCSSSLFLAPVVSLCRHVEAGARVAMPTPRQSKGLGSPVLWLSSAAAALHHRRAYLARPRAPPMWESVRGSYGGEGAGVRRDKRGVRRQRKGSQGEAEKLRVSEFFSFFHDDDEG